MMQSVVPSLAPVVALAVTLALALRSVPIVRGVGERRPALERFAALVPDPILSTLDRSGLGDTGLRLAIAWVPVAVLAVVWVMLAPPSRRGPAVLALLIIFVGPIAALVGLRNRRDRLIEGSLPVALEAMARAVRSGATFTQAVGETAHALVGPLRREFAELHRRLTLGQGFAQVMGEWAVRRPLIGVRLASAAMEFSHDAGGQRSRALDGVADSLRDQAALEAEIAALASQSRLSAVVVALLPLGFVGLSSSVDPTVASFLLGSPLGLACLCGGLTLDAIGFAWMRRMSAVVS